MPSQQKLNNTMNYTVNPANLSESHPAPEAGLASGERSELQRQGAKAAARGEPPETNPLSEMRNKPSATGESAARWLQRSDAWAQGHVAQTLAQRGAASVSTKGHSDERD